MELEGNDKTPQYQQALKVALLNKQRNDMAYHPLRDQYAQLKGKRRALAKAEAANDPQLDAKKAEFTTGMPSRRRKSPSCWARRRNSKTQIYASNQPQPRKYELSPVK